MRTGFAGAAPGLPRRRRRASPRGLVHAARGPGRCVHVQPQVRNALAVSGAPPPAVYLRAMGKTMTSRRKQGPDAPRPDEGSAERTDDLEAAPRRGPRQPRPYPDLVDDTLDDSFPASDPPSFTPQTGSGAPEEQARKRQKPTDR